MPEYQLYETFVFSDLLVSIIEYAHVILYIDFHLECRELSSEASLLALASEIKDHTSCRV